MVMEDRLNDTAKYNNNTDKLNNNFIDGLPLEKEEPNILRSVYRTANILTCISNGIDSITGIANTCGLNKSIVYRLLKAMSEVRLTTRNHITRRYHIGPLISEIASNPNVAHEQLILCAINEMRYLSDYSRESIGLNVLIGLQNVLVLEIPSTYDLRIVAKKKTYGNIHAGANCKILLSQLSSKKLKTVMKNMVLDPITENTITDKEKLLSQLKLIRKQGYAVDYGERISGAVCISVPIKDYLLPATLGILGPESRVKGKINDFISKLQASSGRINDNIREVFDLK
ncbi:MAG: IclR family transcriptional regulator [Deltaproteobacteria bacterium]|nr:IclR family transcriptional regulator [Deltaproteobacteria bacterium]